MYDESRISMNKEKIRRQIEHPAPSRGTILKETMRHEPNTPPPAVGAGPGAGETQTKDRKTERPKAQKTERLRGTGMRSGPVPDVIVENELTTDTSS